MQGWLRLFLDGNFEVYSAGVETHGVNPKAIQVMQEAGIDISTHTSNHVDEYAGIDFDLVITVCDNAKERCPVFPTTARKMHHNFPDPAQTTGTEEEIMAAFRRVRDEIKAFSQTLAKELLLESRN